MFIKYECGCIALDDGQPEVIMIRDCTYSDNITFYRLDPKNKFNSGVKIEPLSQEDSLKYMSEITHLISDGYAFRTMKDLLMPYKD